MDINIEASWEKALQNEFKAPYFKQLISFVEVEYESNECFPPMNSIFAAFNQTHFNDIKVVVLGQDPYHGPKQANGLCFSVAEEAMIPPSLQNIFREINADIGMSKFENGNLQHWAEQGVLLLNATLTVRANEAGSHQKKGWEKFTDAVIRLISENRNGIVFLLWGGYAKKKGAIIDNEKHSVLTSGHPSPLSANRGYWFGNKHFSKTNNWLIKNNKTPINW